MRLLRPCLVVACTLVFAGCARPAEGAPLGAPMTVEVDASDAAHEKLHTHVTIPAHAGELALVYPKWIPGEHGPTGPLVDAVDLHVRANGKELAWRRDSEDMYQVRVTVPDGATKVEVDFDMLHYGGDEFSGASAASSTMVDVVWNQLVLYPKGARVADIQVDASVKLPQGWRWGSALKKKGENTFERTTLEMLVDSPLVAGSHVARYDLGTSHGAPHALTVVGDTEDSTRVPAEILEHYKKLVVEAHALFGARHYDTYDFLVVVSDHIANFGLEHHQSSEDYMQLKAVSDKEQARAWASLLPHEFVHSWNGKYRRPKGLATPDYQQPMKGDLLWVYEGLTNYLGEVLAARSGLSTFEDAKQELANDLRSVSGPGRRWRPLGDTATAAQLLYEAGGAGTSVRRSVDYYPEGTLLWLEVDTILRAKSDGKKSIDDFCHAFHGGKDSGPVVRPYDLDEVLKTLNAVQPNDWKELFAARVDRVAPELPVGGLEAAGYKLGYATKKPELVGILEGMKKNTNAWDSLGFNFDKENEVRDVLAGSPAAKAGLVPHTHLVAIDRRKFDGDVLADALERGKTEKRPIELLVEKDDLFTTLQVDWHGGARWHALERIDGKPDVLRSIFAPKAK